MLSSDQRLEIVEAHMADHSELFNNIRTGLLQFEARVDRRFEAIEARLTALEQKFDARLATLEQRFDTRLAELDKRLTGLDQKVDGLGHSLGAELAAQRRDMNAQFRWTAGILLTGMIAIVAVILSQ